jgi:hypothetical protein
VLIAVRRRLALAVVLLVTATMSACWCAPAAGPFQEPDPPALERGLPDSPGSPSAPAGPGALEPTSTPVTFVIRTPVPTPYPVPDSVSPPGDQVAGVPEPPPATPLPLDQPTSMPTPTPRPAPVPTPGAPPPAPVVPTTPPGPTPSPTPPSPGPVDITLSVNPPSVAPGQPFSVAVLVAAGPFRPVDAVQIYLHF